MKDYKGRVRLVVKMFPYQYRNYARPAALAALEANAQGKFWEMHSALLKYSPDLERDNLIKYGKEAGLDTAKLTDAIDKGRHNPVIEKDLKLASDLGLYGTPTLFINGRMTVGARSYEYLKKIVDEELKHGKAAKK